MPAGWFRAQVQSLWVFAHLQLLAAQEHDTRIRRTMPLNPTSEDLNPFTSCVHLICHGSQPQERAEKDGCSVGSVRFVAEICRTNKAFLSSMDVCGCVCVCACACLKGQGMLQCSAFLLQANLAVHPALEAARAKGKRLRGVKRLQRLQHPPEFSFMICSEMFSS